MAGEGWYYCLVHHTVEPYHGCRSEERLGPYPAREEAQQALQRAQERNEAWDNDPRFNDPDPEDEVWGDSAFDTFKP